MKTLCKLCDKKRYGNLAICYSHYRERERTKKEAKAQKKLDRKLASKGYERDLRKTLKNKAWKLVSEWVRRSAITRNGLAECYTCRKQFEWKELHCGHRHHGNLDLDLRNLKAQCVKCNTFLHGNLGVYTLRLVEEYGLDWCKKLELDANQDLGYSLQELKEIIDEFKL